jgi:hypothetical protein
LGHDEYVLSVSLRPRQSIAGGGPPAAWQGPDKKNPKPNSQTPSAEACFSDSGNYRMNVALPVLDLYFDASVPAQLGVNDGEACQELAL